jgi:hypothetical protein
MGFKVRKVQRPKTVWVYEDVTCDRCAKAVPPLSSITRDEGLQYDNVLILNLVGGYGMFIDPEISLGPWRTYDPETTKILCHECAHEFADWLGWDGHTGHTHTRT